MYCWWECKLIQGLWRTVLTFLKNLKIELTYDPVIPLLGIYPEKTTILKDACTPRFIASLFTIARPKHPNSSGMDEDVIHVYTMEYYSVIKRNKIGSFEETWVDLESVTQSEVSHKEKNMYCILMYICGI